MKRLLYALIAFILLFCIFPTWAHGEDVRLAWDANSESDLAGYRIFMRQSGSSYNYSNPNWQGTATTCTVVAPLTDTLYYFVARAFDTADNESGNSNEVSYRTEPPPDTTPPAAPRNLRYIPAAP